MQARKCAKKDEENLVLFELNIKLLYGRYPKVSFLLSIGYEKDIFRVVIGEVFANAKAMI